MTLGSLQDDSDSERTQRAFREKESNQSLKYFILLDLEFQSSLRDSEGTQKEGPLQAA